jgi:hypothetical protein
MSDLLATHDKNGSKKEAMDAWRCPKNRDFLRRNHFVYFVALFEWKNGRDE